MFILRWLLIIPAAAIVWYVVAAIGLFAYFYVEQNLCPPEDVISGFCYNQQIQMVLAVIMHGFVGISAVAVIVTTALVVPFYKEAVMWTTLVLGGLVAAYFSVLSGDWSLFMGAMTGGLLGAIAVVFFARTGGSQSVDAGR